MAQLLTLYAPSGFTYGSVNASDGNRYAVRAGVLVIDEDLAAPFIVQGFSVTNPNAVSGGSYFPNGITIGPSAFGILESSPGVLKLSTALVLNTNTAQAVIDFGVGSVFTVDFSSGSSVVVLQGSNQLDLAGITGTGSNFISIAPSGLDEIDFTLSTGLGTYLLGTSFQPQADGSLDLGQTSTPRRWGSGFFSTTVQSPLFQVASTAGNTGITTTITTASLVGKTITVKGGIITGFA